jgi:DNA primase
MTDKPTWAVPGAGFMVDFEPPPEVREIVLAPDHDKAGLEAIAKIRTKCRAGATIRRLLPPPGKDWCDVLGTAEERAAIREYDGEEDREQAESKSWVEAFVDGD